MNLYLTNFINLLIDSVALKKRLCDVIPKNQQNEKTRKYFDGRRHRRRARKRNISPNSKNLLLISPNLVDHQMKSYKWLLKEGIAEVFKEFSPIKDYADKKFELSFTGFEVGDPKYDEFQAKEKKISYEGQAQGKSKTEE